MSGSQRGRSRAGAQPRAVSSYGCTLVLAALLAGTLAAACVLVFQGDALPSAIQQASGNLTHLPPDAATTLGVAFDIVFTAMLAAAICAAVVIRTLRLLLFTSGVHAYADSLLRRAPLHQRGIAPRAVPFAGDGQPDTSGERPLEALLRQRQTPRLVLLGEAGSGKTIGLLACAAGLTGTRSVLAAIRKRERRPLPMSLSAFAARADAENIRLLDYLATQVERFGSAGLAARLPRLLRQGRLLLLCDELDAVPPSQRAGLCAELAACAQRYPRTGIAVACRLDAYEDDPLTFAPLHGFTRAVVSGLAADQVRAALAGVTLETAASRPKRPDVVAWLRARALTESVSLAGMAAALLTAAAPGRSRGQDFVGRGELLERALELTIQAAAPDEEHASRVMRLLQQLAAALRTAGGRSFPAPGEDEASAIAALLARHLPYAGAQAPSGGPRPDEETRAPYQPEEIAKGFEIGLSAGILVRSPNGTEVQFAHGLVEAVCAAGWLGERLAAGADPPPTLVRAPWHLPTLLWAGIERPPGAIAEQLLRLAEGHEGAGLDGASDTTAETMTTALALALAALAEGCVCALARASSADERSQSGSSVDRLNERLRDVLDRGLVALDNPVEAARLGHALRSVARSGGPEVAANLGALASNARLSRLVRSQLALMLGLLATPGATQALVGLLGEMDVLIRQSVNQAFMRLGEADRAPLVAALHAAEDRVRDRASEVLRLLDDPAGEPAPEQTPSMTRQMRRQISTRRRNTAAPPSGALKRDEA